VILLLLAALLAPGGGVTVPDGPYILINGIPDSLEWRSSAVVRLSNTVQLRAHKDARSLFLAVIFHGQRHSGIDLFVHTRDTVHELHVSSVLSERRLADGMWFGFRWGNSPWWTANPVGIVMEADTQRVLAPEAFEFHLDRRVLGDDVRIFLHLKRPTRLLPREATEVDPSTWLRLRLGAAHQAP
jgi:hypothetical protein